MAIVQALHGHAMEVVPTQSGRRWRLLCSCGYGRPSPSNPRPSTRATEREAIRQGIWHLQKVEEQRAESARNHRSPEQCEHGRWVVCAACAQPSTVEHAPGSQKKSDKISSKGETVSQRSA
jgi:hypothetical protein